MGTFVAAACCCQVEEGRYEHKARSTLTQGILIRHIHQLQTSPWVDLRLNYPRGSKYPILKDSGSKSRTLQFFWASQSQRLGTWTLWVQKVDPPSGFHNLHHRSIRAQNWGINFLDPPCDLTMSKPKLELLQMPACNWGLRLEVPQNPRTST